MQLAQIDADRFRQVVPCPYSDESHYADGHLRPRSERKEGGRAAPALGLVSIGNKGEVFLLDRDNSRKRLKRMIRGVVTTARLIQEELAALPVRYRSAMITLTYRPGVDWCPQHIKELLTHYRKWFQRRKLQFRYTWVLELTKAGVPHYHIIAWWPSCKAIRPPFPDKQGWWPHGMTEAAYARSPVGYIAKYASKGADGSHLMPKGARLWGAGGLSAPGRTARAWVMAPRWVRDVFPVGSVIKKLDGGWWLDVAMRIRIRSPWEVDLSEGVLRWRGWTSWDIVCEW